MPSLKFNISQIKATTILTVLKFHLYCCLVAMYYLFCKPEDTSGYGIETRQCGIEYGLWWALGIVFVAFLPSLLRAIGFNIALLAGHCKQPPLR